MMGDAEEVDEENNVDCCPRNRRGAGAGRGDHQDEQRPDDHVVDDENDPHHDDGGNDHHDDEDYDNVLLDRPEVVVVDKSRKAQQLYKGAGLAPMVRCSTTPLRALALHYGAHFCYTEELIDKSVIECCRVERNLHTTTGRITHVIDYEKDLASMNDKVRRKHDGLPPLLLRIDPTLETNKLICQLGTGDPDLALKAALVVHKDVTAIDINMGCPKKFSTGGGMGSALLKDPQRAAAIVRNLDSHLPFHPVSAKIRLLDTALATIEFASALIEAGASAIAIHGRRVGDLDTKDADWTSLRQTVTILSQKFPTVPIAINGDFYTRDEFQQFMTETSASAVLLGRPALHNPSIFVEPRPTSTPPMNTAPTPSYYGYDSPLLVDKTTVVQEYVRRSVQYEMHWKNTKYVICEMLNIRRTPASRVHSLLQHDKQRNNPSHHSALTWTRRPTIGETCACKSMEALCELWNVSTTMTTAPAVVFSTDDATGSTNGNSNGTHPSPQQHHPAGDHHNYSDSYILNHVQETPISVNGGSTPRENNDSASSSNGIANDAHPTKKARAGTICDDS